MSFTALTLCNYGMGKILESFYAIKNAVIRISPHHGIIFKLYSLGSFLGHNQPSVANSGVLAEFLDSVRSLLVLLVMLTDLNPNVVQPTQS